VAEPSGRPWARLGRGGADHRPDGFAQWGAFSRAPASVLIAISTTVIGDVLSGNGSATEPFCQSRGDLDAEETGALAT
jgi:hypothetical protein